MLEGIDAIWLAFSQRESRLERDRELLTKVIGDASTDPALANVLAHGLQSFAGAESWLAWLCRPHPRFAGQSPLELLANGEFQSVDAEIGRIDHGVFS
ncbi:MAG: DUF2384 domain-containing protein [Betaproteobacteria bacterium]|nr:DUF2384 domain-containing protein [Betaproteobacteria bacterium]